MISADARELEHHVDALASTPSGATLPEDARAVVRRLLDALESGSVRAASKDPITGEFNGISAAYEMEGIPAFIPPEQHKKLISGISIRTSSSK